MTSFEKRRISMRYWLLGRGYHKAVEAMEFAASYHTGTRKDVVTPEFDHQISIAHYVRTLIDALDHPEDTLCVVFLHDVREDFDVPDEVIRARFGDRVAEAVEAMTKTFRGVKKDPQTVFDAIAADPIASVVKGADRIHNHQTMVGVFTHEKQQGYIAETERFFLPMLKRARRSFPRLEPVYENIKHLLLSQIDLIKAIHATRAVDGLAD